MKQEFFRENRRRLAEAVQGGIVVLSAHEPMQASNDMTFPFMQEPNFWYVTGLLEAGWKVIYDGARDHATLVSPDKTDIERIFDGATSDEDALAISGAQNIIRTKDMEGHLRTLARQHSVVYTLSIECTDHHRFTVNPASQKIWHMCQRIFASTQDCERELSRLRAIKQPVEIAAMKRAAKLSIVAFERAKSMIAAGVYEYEIAAEMTYEFARANATHAYDPIVATGKNACTLHYIKNTSKVHKHQFVLIDVGARLDQYCADITRTYAVGDMSSRARDVHAAVRSAQEQIVALLHPDMSVHEYTDQVDVIMMQAMCDIGLITHAQDRDGYRKYMPHSVSHGLGNDVHESLGRTQVFKPGMVLTVEPGIYIPDEDIGVRIEDDILITPDGHENLTKALSTDCVI